MEVWWRVIIHLVACAILNAFLHSFLYKVLLNLYHVISNDEIWTYSQVPKQMWFYLYSFMWVLICDCLEFSLVKSSKSSQTLSKTFTITCPESFWKFLKIAIWRLFEDLTSKDHLNFVSLLKIYSFLFIPNFTRNHVITSITKCAL